MKKLLLMALAMTCLWTTTHAQVGINTTEPDAILDVEATDSGILIPRVALTATNVAAPITTPTTSELIYNTASAGTGVNAVTPGYYYWNGTVWVRLNAGTDATTAWSLTGNAGTNPANNFIGTTDNTALRFRTNNFERFTITSGTNQANGGRLLAHASGNTSSPVYSWSGDSDMGMYRIGADDLGFVTNGLLRMRVYNNGNVGVNGLSTSVQLRIINNDLINNYGIFATGGNISIVGQNTNGGDGILGEATGALGYGVYGFSNNATGVGMVAGNSDVTGVGLLAFGNSSGAYTSDLYAGSYLNGISSGLVSYGNSTNGWGVVGAGNNLAESTIAGGGGGSFRGYQWGVFANTTVTGPSNNGTDRAAFRGQYISGNNTTANVYVGARIDGQHYKILGQEAGSVSTTMQTRDGERILFAPEATENWFFDMGEVQLVNGKATVELDALFIDCISDTKPFKVFVQGAEDTMGSIRISRNQDAKTFVLEDMGGPSNGIVMFSVYGIWRGKEDLRLPVFSIEDGNRVEYQEKVEQRTAKKELSKVSDINE